MENYRFLIQEQVYNLKLMRLLDDAFTERNFTGVSGLRDHLSLVGHAVNAKRLCCLVRRMGHEQPTPNRAAGMGKA